MNNSQIPTPKSQKGQAPQMSDESGRHPAKVNPVKQDVPFDLRDRTFLFSVRAIKWVRTLPKDHGTQIAARQFLRSATSIGANYEEADGADTHKDRVYKWSLCRKEAREARYWTRVICAAGADSKEGRAVEQETTELVNILSALIRKGKQNLKGG